MSVGLETTATIKINLDFDGGKNLSGLKSVFSALGQAMDASGALKRFEALEATITELKGSLATATRESARLSQELENSSRESIAAVARENAAIQRTAATRAQADRAALELREDMNRKVALTVGIYKRGEQAMKALDARSETAVEGLVAGWKKLGGEVIRVSKVMSRPADAKATMGLVAGLAKLQAGYKKAADEAKKLADEKAFAQTKAGWQQAAVTLNKYGAGVKEVGKLFKGLGSSIKGINSQQKSVSASIAKSGDQMKNAWDAAFDAAKKTSTQTIAQTQLMIRLNKAMLMYGKSFVKDNRGLIVSIKHSGNESVESLRNLSRQLDIVTEKQEEHNAAMRGANGVLDGLKYRLTHYEQQMDAIFRASFRMQMVGNNLIQFARDILRTGSQMMTTFGDFEYTMNRAAGALSIWEDSTKGGVVGVDALQESILGLSVDMKLFPAKEVAEALYFWGSATGSAVSSQSDLRREMTALEPVMKAAIMTNTGYETTIKGVYAILSQYYNGAVGMAAMVTEQLFYVTQKTAVEFSDLINSFKMVGPIARANNVTFQEMVELFGRIGDLGIRGSMAGRAFRQLFIQLVKPSGPAKKAISGLFNSLQGDMRDVVKEFQGRSYYDMVFPKGDFVGVKKYIDILARATMGLSTSSRNAYLAQTTTANELPVLTALVVDQQRAINGLNTTTKGTLNLAQEAASYFEKNWKRLSGSWNATIGGMQRLWEALQIQVGAVVAKTLEPFIKSIGEVIQKIREWAASPANQAIIGALTKVAALAGGLAAVSGVVLTLTGTIMGLVAVFYVVGRSFAQLIPMAAKVTGVFGALVDGIVRNFDEIRASVQYAVDKIGEAFGSGEGAADSLMRIWDAMMQPIRGMIDLFIKGGSTLIRVFADIVSALAALDKVVPILSAVAAVLGVLIAQSMLSGLLRLTMSITGLSKVLNMFSASNAAGRIGIAGLIIGDAKHAASGLGAIKGGIAGIRSAIGNVVSLVGPGGFVTLALGAGFLAYEMNLFGFRDGINNITDAFRDMNKELAEMEQHWGDINNIGKRVVNTAKEIAVGQAKGGTVIEELGADYGMYAGTFNIKFPDGTTNTASTREDAAKAADDWAIKQADVILEEWKKASLVVNDRLAKADLPPVSVDAYAQMIQKVSGFISDPATLTRVVDDIIFAQAQGGYGKAVLEKLAVAYQAPDGVYEVAKMGVAGFVQTFYDAGLEAAQMADFSAKAVDKMYAPLIDKIQNAIASGTFSEQQISDMFTNTNLVRNQGGLIVDAMLPVADMLGQMTPLMQERVGNLLQSIGGIMGDYVDENGDLVADPIYERFNDLGRELGDVVSASINAGFLDNVNKYEPDYRDFTELIAAGDVESFNDAASLYKDVFIPALMAGELPKQMHDALLSAAELLVQKAYLTAAELEAIKAGTYIPVSGILGKILNGAKLAVEDFIKKAPVEFDKALDDGKVVLDDIYRKFMAWKNGTGTRGAVEGGVWGRSGDMITALSGSNQLGEAYVAAQEALAAKAEEAKAAVASGLQAIFDAVASLKDEARDKAVDAIQQIADNIASAKEEVQSRVDAGLQIVTSGISPIIEKHKADWVAIFVGAFNGKQFKQDIMAAIKKGSDFEQAGKLLKELTSKGMRRGLGGNQESRFIAREWMSGNIAGWVAAYNAAGPRLKAKLGRQMVNWFPKNINDLPPRARTLLTPIYNDIVGNVQIDGKTQSETAGKLNKAVAGILANVAILRGKGTRKKPTQVFIEVKTRGGKKVDALVAKVTTAKSVINTLLNAVFVKAQITLLNISLMPWISVGLTAGKMLASGLNVGLKSNLSVSSIAQNTLSALRMLPWYSGGYNSGAAWARGLNLAVKSGVDTTVGFVASVTIGKSPPIAGPLKDIDKGGYNVGKAWGHNMGKGAREEMMMQTRRMNDDLRVATHANQMRNMGGIEVGVNNKKEVVVKIQVSSPDGSVDRVKQSELRKGVIDALVVADLEHYVTIG